MSIPPSVPPLLPEEFLVPTNAKLDREIRTAAGCLFAFAGLTIVNLALTAAGVPLHLVVSLIVVEYVYAIGRELGSVAPALAIVFGLFASAAVAALGWFAYRRAVWALYVGAALILADAVITYFVTTLAGIWPFVMHGVALWFVYLGIKAAKLHRERRQAGKA